MAYRIAAFIENRGFVDAKGISYPTRKAAAEDCQGLLVVPESFLNRCQLPTAPTQLDYSDNAAVDAAIAEFLARLKGSALDFSQDEIEDEFGLDDTDRSIDPEVEKYFKKNYDKDE